MRRLADFLVDSLKAIAGGVIGSASLLVFNIVAATVLSEAEFGVLTAAFAHANLGLTVAGFGISGFFVKASVEEPGRIAASGHSILWFCLLASLVSGLLIFIGAFSSSIDAVRSITLTLLPLVLGYTAAELGAAVSQVRDRFSSLALWLAATGLSRLGLLMIIGVLNDWQLAVDVIAWGVAAASVVVAVCAAPTVLEIIKNTAYWRPQPAVTPFNLIGILKRAAPFGTANGLYLLYSQAPVLVLAHFASMEVVGAYGVAMMVIMSAYLVPSLIIQRVLLVKIIRSVDKAPSSAHHYLLTMTWRAAFAGVFSAILLYHFINLFAPKIGIKYSEVTPLISILIISLPIKFAEAVVGGFLSAKSGIFYKNVAVMLSIIIQYPLLVYLANRYEHYGVAGGYLITEAILFFLYYLFVKKKVFSSVI